MAPPLARLQDTSNIPRYLVVSVAKLLISSTQLVNVEDGWFPNKGDSAKHVNIEVINLRSVRMNHFLMSAFK